MRCLWDFYSIQFTNKIFYLLAFIELIGFIWLGYNLIKHRRKTKLNLFGFSLILLFVVPPIEAFITCYPLKNAFFREVLLVILLWLGVLVWKVQERFGEKHLKKYSSG